MRKSFLPPLIFLAAGALGALMKYYELSAVIDPATGLAEASPLSAAMGVYALIGVLAAFIFSRVLVKPEKRDRAAEKSLRALVEKKTALSEEEKALLEEEARKVKEKTKPSFGETYSSGYFELALSFFCGALLIASAILVSDFSDSAGIFGIVVRALTAASGASLIFLGYSAYKRKDGPLTMAASSIPAVLMVLVLAQLYRESSEDPVVIRYMLSLAGTGAGALAYLYEAGYAFGSRSERGSVWLPLAAIFLLTAAQGERLALFFRVISCVTVVYLFITLLNRLRIKIKRQRIQALDDIPDGTDSQEI